MLNVLLAAAEGGMSAIHIIEAIGVPALFLILTVSHLLHVSYLLLHWPNWLVKRIEHNREDEIRRTLVAMGFDGGFARSVRREEMSKTLKELSQHHKPVDRCVALLRKFMKKESVSVGVGYSAPFPYFVDLMSASMQPEIADECANILIGYLRTLRSEELPDFDLVIGLKQGSPLIAAAFGRRLKKPVSFFRGAGEFKYNQNVASAATLFDGQVPSGVRVLIVDDSTTGGAKAAECINAIREVGGIVTHIAVLFEPLGKDGRLRLSEKQVELISVVRMDSDTLEKIDATV